MAVLRYAEIETQLVEALPELAPAAACYWKREGAPGFDCGPYVFFEDVFALYVQILIALSDSPRRDELLRRAFVFVEEMIAGSDPQVRDLAFIGLFEGREDGFFAGSRLFVGPLTSMVLDERWPTWRAAVDQRLAQSANRLLDGYRIRRLIADQLHIEGITLDQVPGETYVADERSV